MSKIRIEILRGSEGYCLAINDYRICGVKPFGGASVAYRWLADSDTILKAMKLPLSETNPYCKDKKKFNKDIKRAVKTSTAIEKE